MLYWWSGGQNARGRSSSCGQFFVSICRYYQPILTGKATHACARSMKPKPSIDFDNQVML
jgi:hypothetical protein